MYTYGKHTKQKFSYCIFHFAYDTYLIIKNPTRSKFIKTRSCIWQDLYNSCGSHFTKKIFMSKMAIGFHTDLILFYDIMLI